MNDNDDIKTLRILVQNIEYDTIADDIDHHSKLTVDEIPNACICVIEVEDDSFDPCDMAQAIRKTIEDDWLVDRFDWEIIGTKPQQAYHVECQCRREYGVAVWDDPIWLNNPTYLGHPFTCVPISRELKAA
jgi:hypothetical protein